MEDNNIRIVEIGGIKVEVDLRNAKVISHYKVGDKVRVLKKYYGDQFKSSPGVIIGFDNFQNSPTIRLAVLTEDYSGAKIEFESITKDSKEIEICSCDDLGLLFQRSDVIQKLDREIYKAEEKVQDLKRQKSFFISHFDTHFKIED